MHRKTPSLPLGSYERNRLSRSTPRSVVEAGDHDMMCWRPRACHRIEQRHGVNPTRDGQHQSPLAQEQRANGLQDGIFGERRHIGKLSAEAPASHATPSPNPCLPTEVLHR
jgi:hypothetical protein